MARIRSVKPELPQDAKLASVSRETRYHFVLLWTVSDDHGFFRASPRLLLGQLYPHDADMTERLVELMTLSLSDLGVVLLCTTPDGLLGWVVNWKKHQKIDRPSQSHLREIFAAHSREYRERFDAGVLSPESLVLSPESGEAPGRSRSNGKGKNGAAAAFAKILDLIDGRTIALPRVEALGPRVTKAYTAIGGSARFIDCPHEKRGLLLRDFTQVYEGLADG